MGGSTHRTQRLSDGGLPIPPPVFRPSGSCEAEAARRYAFDGFESAPGWERIRCPSGARYRMFFLRSRAEGPSAELCWRVYEICDAHVHRLRQLDDGMTHAGHLSQLHPLTSSALRLIEPAEPRAVRTVDSVPAV